MELWVLSVPYHPRHRWSGVASTGETLRAQKVAPSFSQGAQKGVCQAGVRAATGHQDKAVITAFAAIEATALELLAVPAGAREPRHPQCCCRSGGDRQPAPVLLPPEWASLHHGSLFGKSPIPGFVLSPFSIVSRLGRRRWSHRSPAGMLPCFAGRHVVMVSIWPVFRDRADCCPGRCLVVNTLLG